MLMRMEFVQRCVTKLEGAMQNRGILGANLGAF